MPKEELLVEVKKLIGENAYKQVLELLPDSILEKQNDDELYRSRACAKRMLWNTESAMEDAKKALSLNPNSLRASYEKAAAHSDLQEYDIAIKEFNKIIYKDSNYVSAYYCRANAWFYKEFYENALSDYKKTIELEPDAKDALLFAGVCLRKLGKYDDAIKQLKKTLEVDFQNYSVHHEMAICWALKKKFDVAEVYYQNSIELNPKNPTTYYDLGVMKINQREPYTALEYFTHAIEKSEGFEYKEDIYKFRVGRANLYKDLGEKEKAKQDLVVAIDLIPHKDTAYISLGNVYGILNDYDKAIKCFSTAIKCNKTNSVTHMQRGYTFERSKMFSEAIQDYRTALKLNPENKSLYSFISRVEELIDEECILNSKAEIVHKEKNTLAQFFINTLINSGFKTNQTSTLLSAAITIKKNIIDAIKDIATVKVEQVKETDFVHYTKLDVLNSMLFNTDGKLDGSGKQRYYNATYMNDPEEGNVLLECLGDDIKTRFNDYKAITHNFYIGSFIPASKHDDELIMWRTYGKDKNGVEGAGCSITVHKNFFDIANTDEFKSYTSFYNESNVNKGNKVNQHLYRVIYYDSYNKKVLGEDSEKIEKLLYDLKSQVVYLLEYSKNDSQQEAINIIIYHLLSEIRYLFKKSDYDFENEVRVIQSMSPNSRNIKIDPSNGTMRKLFIESNKSVFPYLRKVVLGPKVPKPDQWIYIRAIMEGNGNKNFELVRSKHKFQ